MNFREGARPGKLDTRPQRRLAMTDDEVKPGAAKNGALGPEPPVTPSHEEYNLQITKGITSEPTGRSVPCVETRTGETCRCCTTNAEYSSYGEITGEKRRHRQRDKAPLDEGRGDPQSTDSRKIQR